MFNNIPTVTKNLLLINILVYVVALVSAETGGVLHEYLGGHYFNSPLFEPYQLITHMFSHSLTDVFHIIFNMFLLVMFGGHLERIWGAKRYFIFYIAAGLGAFVLFNSIGVWKLMELQNVLVESGTPVFELERLASNDKLISYLYAGNEFGFSSTLQNLVDDGFIAFETATKYPNELVSYLMYSHSTIVGASGAIFGLLAGFAVLFPNTQLMLLFPPIPIKAKYLIGGYLLFEVYNSFYSSGDSIAHLAHVGGAVVGIILVLIWRKKDRTNFY